MEPNLESLHEHSLKSIEEETKALQDMISENGNSVFIFSEEEL
jgi:hypothetical protein